MRDLKISGNNWDISQFQNDLVFESGPAEVSQSSAIRLLLISGEQFDDIRVGVPWLTDMVSTQVSIATKRGIIRKILKKTFGVKSVESLVLDNDGTIHFEGMTENNEFFSGAINA